MVGYYLGSDWGYGKSTKKNTKFTCIYARCVSSSAFSRNRGYKGNHKERFDQIM